MLDVVGIAGEDGDQPVFKQGMGDELRGFAEVAGDRAGGHLQQAALFEEGLELARAAHDALVALRVGDHRHDVVLQ
ncbi:hypothetical protein D3C81_1749370 [compost metagenome]